jgi:hypothetical protein
MFSNKNLLGVTSLSKTFRFILKLVCLQAVPDQISKLENLQTLLLFINELSKLPESICNMTQLRCLWVGNNRYRFKINITIYCLYRVKGTICCHRYRLSGDSSETQCTPLNKVKVKSKSHSKPLYSFQKEIFHW